MSKYKIILIILIVLGFVWRYIPISQNYSFWTDEGHVAVFSRAVSEKGKPVLDSGFNIGIYQLPMYWLGAIGLKLFGNNEIAIRWPSLIFGTLTILAVYLLSVKLFSKTTGLLAAFFMAFINIEILWSIQARSYQALQFFWVIGSYFSFRYLEERNIKYLIFSILCGLLSIFFHPLGAIYLCVQAIIYLILFLFNRKDKHLRTAFIVFSLICLPLLYYFKSTTLEFLLKINNFYYYRIFLTRNYFVLLLFSFVGFLILLKRKTKKQFLFLSIPLLMQFMTVTFLNQQPFLRYFYPAFAYIIIIASYGILETGYWMFSKLDTRYRILDIRKRKEIRNQKLDIRNNKQFSISHLRYLISSIFIFIVIIILLKTNKISLFPKKIYSLNEDMQEIPEVDWKKIYELVGNKLKSQPGTVLVTNWMDTPLWFLGDGKLDYLVRLNNDKKDFFSGAVYLNNLDKLKEVISNNKKGIIVLDSWDSAIPEGVSEYCRDNLKKELEIDRLYPIQPRYWPVNVYSWNTEN